MAAEASLDVGRRLIAFNWLCAAYAHRDWLGDWATVLEPREQASLRLIRRGSLVLLEQHGLQNRYLREVGSQFWLLEPRDTIGRLATLLGVAMLGGWVRHRLERHEVARQLKVLGRDKRQQALQRALELRALPFGPGPCGTWPVETHGPGALFRLGVSCLAAMADDASSGARERFTLRFARGTVVPLALTPAQRDEALAVVLNGDDAPSEQVT